MTLAIIGTSIFIDSTVPVRVFKKTKGLLSSFLRYAFRRRRLPAIGGES